MTLPAELFERLSRSEYQTDAPDIQRIILLSTGSFNPIHREHVRMTLLAKEQLESNYINLQVVASVFSASHDSYLRGKMRKALSDATFSKHRLQMIQLGLNEEKEMPGENFACVDSWESEQSNFIDFPDVTRSLQQRVDERFGVNKFRVWFLCGLDHADKCHLFHNGVRDSYGDLHSFVCVYRPGTPLSHEALIMNPAIGILVNNDSDNEVSVSSTLIREASRNYDIKLLNKLTYGSVVQFMLNNGIFGL